MQLSLVMAAVIVVVVWWLASDDCGCAKPVVPMTAGFYDRAPSTTVYLPGGVSVSASGL